MLFRVTSVRRRFFPSIPFIDFKVIANMLDYILIKRNSSRIPLRRPYSSPILLPCHWLSFHANQRINEHREIFN